MCDAGAWTWPDLPGEVRRRSTYLPMQPTAARTARLFAGAVLADWDLKDAADDVEACVSELVSNAYRHGSAACGDAGGGERRGIWLTLHLEPKRLRIEVRDFGGGEPVMRPSTSLVAAAGDECDMTDLPESGTGLHVVQALSDGWTWHSLSTGKIVSCWFTVNTEATTRVSARAGPGDR